MPRGVIELRSRERVGWLARLDPVPVLRTLRIGWRRQRRLREGDARNRSRRTHGRREPGLASAAGQGAPVLVTEADGSLRCVACGLCAFACPTGCITVVPAPESAEPVTGGTPDARRPERFALDLGRCIGCGLCEEACPEVALVLAPLAHGWADGRSGLVLERDALCVPASVLGPHVAASTGSLPSPAAVADGAEGAGGVDA